MNCRYAWTSVARIIVGGSLVVGMASQAHGQSSLTANTLRLDDVQQRPSATIDDVAWLAGSWVGAAFGGTVEEVWTPPSAGTMVGLFKLVTDGDAKFYEIAWIAEEEGSLVFKLKHFHADFTGWEERDELIAFPLVRMDKDAVYFDGLTFRRVGDDALAAHLALHREGKWREEELAYWRADGN